ncbi:hypothetical protein PM738_04300 [Erysipelatoclostridium ramosum]|uniref:Uncharacterized protein n=1 Tax=Thomasclavelia ramosa TaxID=1547 RepID=A0AB35IK77_9FIRM|nr:hypothetical protein [Thomasclavelia ramosa]MDB7083014.1 hypothetical protein [Thomasclavelia ramosa]
MTKLLARYHHRVINPDTGNLEITFAISDYNSKANTEELEKELYSLEIKKPRSKRSLNQNAYLWSLIHELALKMDEDDLDVYIKLLNESKAKYEVLKVLSEAENDLKKCFRVVKLIKYDVNKDYAYFQCYYGSSTFTTDEMNKLIDTAISWCNELNIPTLEGDIYGM